MKNKQLVENFFKDVFINGDVEKIKHYVAENYIQHNPQVKNGLDGFTEFFKSYIKSKPKFDVMNISCEADMVYVFYKTTIPDGSISKVCDIYRVENNKIAEHWDVIESHVEKIKSVNHNSVF